MKMRRMVLSLVVGGVTSVPLAAQIPRSSGQGGVVAAAPKMMVATPHVFTSADSAAAVQFGAMFRDRMSRATGRDFQVIPREQMNEALVLWGYPPDAILPNHVSNLFAKQLNARTLVNTAMTVEADGRIAVTSRLAGVNDEAGFVIEGMQAPGESVDDFAKDLADEFKDPIKAYGDAKECMTLSRTADKRSDAIKAADRAIRRVPDHGLAEMCLARIAREGGAPSDSIVAHLERAIVGDPLSLPAYTALATEFEARGDTARVIESFQAMLLIAPTNEALRTNAIKLFNQYGRPDAAVAIADAGIERDPFNPDFYDLKANAHAVAGQMPDALGALAQIYELDSTGVDSTYFLKVLVFAEAAGDTAEVLRFAQIGARRYPTNTTLLEQLASGYATAGALDSAIAVTRRLNEMDPTTTTAALKTALALSDSSARRVADAIPFAEFVAANGTDAERINAANILMTGALPLLQEPRDLDGAIAGSRKAIELAEDDQPAITRTANYILGLSAFLKVASMDEETEATKSCEMANEMKTMLAESKAALRAGRATNPDQVDTFLGYVGQYEPRVESMIGAYCD